MIDGARQSQAEARQLLALLRAVSRPGAVATWLGQGAPAERQLSVQSDPSRDTRTPIRFSARLVASAASLGLVADSQGLPWLTPAGHAWLRRQLASDDPFLEQHRQTRHRQLAGAKSNAPRLRINDAESPLAWLRRRKDRKGAAILDEVQFDAGERLRRDYTFAAMLPRVTADWSKASAPGARNRAAPPAGNLRDDVIVAKERVHRAIAAVGPELGRILVDVCCLLKGIETAEAEQGLPQRSGKVVLQFALNALARHYGLLADHSRQRGASAMLHWGTADFRPML